MLARVFKDDKIKILTDPKEIQAAIVSPDPVWIELEREAPECNHILIDVLHIHPLTVEDIWGRARTPKLEDYREYLYVVVHGVKSAKRGSIDTIELDVVLGKTWVLTHDSTGEITKEVAEALDRDPTLLNKGPAWLAHAILDNAVDHYLPIIDHLNEDIDRLETEALAKAGTPKGGVVLKRILKFRRLLQDLRRMSIHQREILLRLARGEFDEIPREVVPFFRDVYDHFVRITDLIESFRDLVTSALEAYLTVQANRMNEVMKTLTLISTVMLPLTFIVGLYGMNFEHMPELHWLYGYPFAIGMMAVVVIGILYFFKRKGWIGGKDELPEDRPRPPKPPKP